MFWIHGGSYVTGGTQDMLDYQGPVKKPLHDFMHLHACDHDADAHILFSAVEAWTLA